MDAEGGAQPVWLTGEDLTRILVNLVKNAAEAMPAGGRIALGLREFHAAAKAGPWLMLTIEDNGPGIPQKALEKIFESGYTTRAPGAQANGGWPAAHRGLGLSITRSIVEAAGGRIHAANRDSRRGRASRSSCPSAPAETGLPAQCRDRQSQTQLNQASARRIQCSKQF